MILAPQRFSEIATGIRLGSYYLSRSGAAAWICAAGPAILFAVNVFLFTRPGRGWNRRPLPAVSVLIPARNEEETIRAAMRSVLASRGVELELVVLDDGSTDRTADIVRSVAEEDARVRLEIAPPLPEGWTGKQHACWVLASRARHDVFCFLDADVRLEQEALYRMASELNFMDRGRRERAMVSGFPRQRTDTLLEKLLLPLIHFILLSFLPFAGERWTGMAGFAAGCGQFMMVRRDPYLYTGGHSAIRTSMHDGLLLPQLFRQKGFRTSVYDLSRDAVCRMYRSAGEVWSGLGKNATEGMATPLRLPFFTVVLLVGQLLPWVLLFRAVNLKNLLTLALIVGAIELGLLVRIVCAIRYRQSWLSVVLHPVGVTLLLTLQWYALIRKLFGGRATWKDRVYRVG